MTLTQQQQQNWSVWEERWQALDQTLTDLASYYDGLPSDFPRKETLTYLVKHLQAFGEKQFYFFRDGFYYAEEDLIRHEENSRVILDDSDVFQPEYVLQATLDQISHDLEVIQRAANARLPNSPKRMRDTLDLADKLAWKYLQPALEANLVEQGTTVLTYFQKSASIRLIPYAPVALIGIPPTAFRTPKPGAETTGDTLVARDLLTTAHEVGHYVYRRGKYRLGKLDEEPIYRKLDREFNGIPDPENKVNKWAEEIFADVYGSLSGGAVTALSSQDLALRYYSKREFFKDDGEHPPPNFRPYIYVKVLKKVKDLKVSQVKDLEMKGKVKSTDDLMGSDQIDGNLRNRWDNDRSNRETNIDLDKIKAELKDQFELGYDVISFGSEIRDDGDDAKPVDQFISKVLDILKTAVEQVSSDQVEELLNQVSVVKVDVNGLYPNFRAKLVGQETMESPEELKLNREVPEDQLNPWEKWIEKEKFFTFKDVYDNEIPEIPERGLKKAGYEEDISSKQPPREKNTWIPVAYCAGWSTKIGNHSGG